MSGISPLKVQIASTPARPRGRLGMLATSFGTKGGLARNLLATLIWQGANYLAPLLTFPHLARTLGPSGFGQYGIYLLVGGWMTIASDWGTNYTGSRLIAQQRALTGDIDEAFWNIFFLRGAIIVAILAGVGVYLGMSRASFGQAQLLLAAWTIILGNALTVSWCLQGLERLDGFAAASLIGRLFTVPATILLVRHADQVWVAVAVQGGGGIVIGMTSIVILYRMRAVKSLRWSWRASRDQARDGWPVLISTASHGLYSSTATALLGLFHGTYATGLFVAADRVRLAAQGVFQPIGQAVYPRTSRLAVTDRPAAVRTVRLLLAGLVSTMFCCCLVITIFAPWIIYIIAGPHFAESAAVLRILAFAICAYGANAVLGWQTLMPFGFSKEFGRVTSSAALVNVVAMPGLVYTWGVRGAAVGVLLTETFMLVCYSVIIVRRRVLMLDSSESASEPAVETHG